jgi:proline racemase
VIAMSGPMRVSVTEYHTAGEPFRIVTGGVGPIPGATILDKRRYAREHLDPVRQLLINEPRGHADMYGCFVTDPVDDGAAFGTVFFHNEGYSTACGHGTIALATWAVDSGIVRAQGAETPIAIDVPSGRVHAIASTAGSRVPAVRFRNVPSFVHAEGIAVQTPLGATTADIAFGGAFYASVDAATLGLAVVPGEVGTFIELGRLIKRQLGERLTIRHPDQPELEGIYGVIFHERRPDADGRPCQRNVTVFADGEVDRSPCGSGTSARLALLHQRGELARGQELVHLSIIDTEFRGRVVDAVPAGVITEVEGGAHLSGFHQFVLEPDDPLGTGFLLR